MTLVLASLTLLAAAGIKTGLSDTRSGRPDISTPRSTLISISTAAVYPPKPDAPCPGSRRAIAFYRAAYNVHRTTMRLPGAPPLVEGGCNTARTMAAKWRDLAHRTRRAAARWVADQFHWWDWLPDKWRRVATCETHLNWAHDSGTYVSAFGIYRPAYADDAAHVGLPAWDDPGQRTPREQYETALSHYRLHGGFSGWGCRGA